MTEKDDLLEQTQMTFLETHFRICRLESQMTHTPGGIVRKGPERQYTYWQFRQSGKQIQRYVKAKNLASVEALIAKLKSQKAQLAELKRFLKLLKKMLRAAGIQWQKVLDEYSRQERQKQENAEERRAAQEAASQKKYAENYKHLTDKGDQVASKSEQIIANLLYAYGVNYAYEKEITVCNVKLKPDFTIWRPDGSVVLWEHAGLLDQQDYARNFEKKLQLYQRGGYRQPKNLIITQDVNGAFNAEEARNMIKIYKLV